jgi:hypothetical protein
MRCAEVSVMTFSSSTFRRYPRSNSDWLALAEGLAGYLEQDPGPVCFFLGAGASISSGGPRTNQVLSALPLPPLNTPANARYSARDLWNGLNKHQRRTAISSLFDGFISYLGYLCLAAMGRRRQVLVVNLNWDDGVERACKRLGVPCRSFDIAEASAVARAFQEAEGAFGVICVHLHGRLADETRGIRLTTLETLSFAEAESRLLLEQFLIHPTVIVGTSLSDNTDVTALLKKASHAPSQSGDPKPLWLFRRSATEVDIWDSQTDLLSARDSVTNSVSHPTVDFDRLMLIASGVIPRRSSPRRESLLPAGAGLVLPNDTLLRAHLDAPVLVLAGEPNLGKTTLATVLAHFRALVDGSDLKRRRFEGPTTCLQAISGLSDGDDPTLLILEDPFGPSEQHERNPQFRDQVLRVAGQPGRNRVIITTRLADWARATHGATLPGIAQLSSNPADWYDATSLEVFARAQEQPPSTAVMDQIRSRHLNTPAVVRAALTGSAANPDDDVKIVQDKIGVLRLNQPLQRLVALVRLQEFSNEPRSLKDLASLAGVDVETALDQYGAFLRTYTLDDRVYARLSHSTTGKAADELLRSSPMLLASVDPAANRWIDEAKKVWLAVEAARNGDRQALRKLPQALLSEWAGMLMATALEPAEVLNLIPVATLDFWSLCDLCNSVVRLWPDLQGHPVAERFISRTLKNREQMGTYALLEAALSYQGSTDQEIWDRLAGALWDLSRRSSPEDMEPALVIDALWWRPSANRSIDAVDWSRRLLQQMSPDSPRRGAVAFAALYHRRGTAQLLEQASDLGPSDLFRVTTKEQAAQFTWMMRWHFMHQSRSRAIIHRWDVGGMEELPYLRRSLYPQVVERDPESSSAEYQKYLRAVLLEVAHWPEHAGWAFHLALNLRVTTDQLDGTSLLEKLLSRCAPGDEGAISAILTYGVPPELHPQLQTYLSEPSSLLDALARGFRLDGTKVASPRFLFLRDVAEIYQTARLTWPNLERLGINARSHLDLARGLRAVADEVVERYGCSRARVESVIERVSAGDLRQIEVAATLPRQAADSPEPEAITAGEKEREKERARCLHVLLNACAEARAAAADAGPTETRTRWAWSDWETHFVAALSSSRDVRATLHEMAPLVHERLVRSPRLDREWQGLGVSVAVGRIEASGMHRVTGGRPSIIVSGQDRHWRQRFTVAHELGHLFLRSARVAEPGLTLPDKDEEESLCDDFASQVLIPRERLRSVLAEGGFPTSPKDVFRLCRTFNVGVHAMMIALSESECPTGQIVLLARRRGHKNRKKVVGFRLEVAIAPPGFFLASEQRLKTVGLRNLDAACQSVKRQLTLEGSDDLAASQRRPQRDGVDTPVTWQAEVRIDSARPFVVAVLRISPNG